MSNPWIVIVVTFGLIAVSAFFVAVEFALLAARRHRLEEAAERSTSARYALRSTRELSVLLAGCNSGSRRARWRWARQPNPLCTTGLRR